MNKRILIINSRPPYPLYTGGEMRTYQMIKLLSSIYENIDIAYLAHNETSETKKGIAPYCKGIYSFPAPGRISILIRTLLGLLTGKLPLQVHYFYSSSMQKWIDKNINKYDLVFCNNIRTAEYIRNNKNTIKVIDFVDAISMNYERAKKKTKGLWKLLYSIDHKRCLAYELDLLNKFDKTIIISPIDASYILKHCKDDKKEIAVISNMIAVPSFIKTDYEEKEPSLVFVGSMFYESNINAVVFFVEQIFDKVRNKYPDIKFYIVGSKPDAKVRKLAEVPGVIVTGFVDSVDEYFVNPSIFVAPMLSGAGVQNKILQAMAAGCPVITTTIGAEGILDITEEELIVRDDPDEMAHAIIDLLEDNKRRKSQAEKARKYILENLSEEIILEKFKNMMIS
ncbi:MAG: glycosyltransferase family 4 protein [Candidatus Azobacteroides sp.]|nr:glycosyltransferase family 4 protein [Candidatus Azobacteroides sp.]